MKVFAGQCWTWAILVLFAVTSNAGAALIGHWTFDEGGGTTAFDSSGNGLNGAITNGAYTAGRIGSSALYFDGYNTYVTVLNNALLVPETIGISLWFKTTNPGNGRHIDLLDKGHGTGSYPYYAGYVIQTDSSESDFTGLYGNGSWFYGAGTDFSWWDGIWHHLVVNLGQDGSQFYIDGILRDETDGAGPLVQNDSDLYFGRHRTQGRYFLGAIDDVRLYDTALSQSEVNALFVLEPSCPSVDLTGDCFVDMEDFALFAFGWLRNDCVTPDWCGGADFDTSGDVEIEDLVELAMQWLTGVRI